MDLNKIKDLASKENIADIKEKVSDIAKTVEEKAHEIGAKIDKFPGAATDVADGEKVSPKMVKEDVKSLNNNPRNNDI